MPIIPVAAVCSDCGEWKDGGDFPMFSTRCRVCAKRHAADLRLQKTSPFQGLAEWKAFCARYGDVCLMCREALPLTVDHIDPFGPRFDIANVQPLCKRCNCVKGQRFWDFRQPGPGIKFMRVCQRCGSRMAQTAAYYDGTLGCTNARCRWHGMAQICPIVRIPEGGEAQ